MATIGTATVAVGDWLRDNTDDWEGRVTATDGDDVTLRMNNGEDRTRPAGDLHYNSWDPKASDAPPPPPATAEPDSAHEEQPAPSAAP